MRRKPNILLFAGGLLIGFCLHGWSEQKPDSFVKLSAAQSREVVQAAWQDVDDLFYDSNFRGVNWARVRSEYLERASSLETREQLESLISQMLSTLHNSHIGVMTHEEYARTRNVLPFFFNKIAGRVFVSYVFKYRGGKESPLRFGDEVLEVDGQPASELVFPSVTWLQPIMHNPYYGAPNSIAMVEIRRRGSILNLKVSRVQAFGDVVPLEVRHYGTTGYLRFLKMDEATISPAMLRNALDQVADSRAIILDFRHCVGGDGTVADLLGGMLLGPGIRLVTRVPRPDAAHTKPLVEVTTDFRTIFKGKVVILIDHETQSEPEMLTAALLEYERVTAIGNSTSGALNGFTEAMALPDRVGIIAIPVNRSISPKGNEYEGKGVAPTFMNTDRISYYTSGRDRVLEEAVRMASN